MKFALPVETVISHNYDSEGFSPKPTSNAIPGENWSPLLARQDSNTYHVFGTSVDALDPTNTYNLNCRNTVYPAINTDQNILGCCELDSAGAFLPGCSVYSTPTTVCYGATSYPICSNGCPGTRIW
ncbi:hypothetical protein FH972_022675 [Carpinus fangiana]|uniref:Uncharacterized protein n=1 Tax=Carpinus fangiana TaxID=176857 RepID=A0A5N6KTH4_9ROSI|nr:hypothetical protein FH972_022675 [Carpinus fangiana]